MRCLLGDECMCVCVFYGDDSFDPLVYIFFPPSFFLMK